MVNLCSNKRGSTLIETIIAFGLLVAGFAIFARLMIFGLKGMDRGEDSVRATGIARTELTRLRAEAQMGRWSDLLAENGSVRTEDGFQVSLEVFERQVYSPSTAWESPHLSTPEARRLFGPESCQAQAVVRVTGQGAEAVLTTIIPRPEVTLADPAIVIDNLPGGLGAGGSVTLRARLLSDTGDEIPCTFKWNVLPGSGNATLDPSRNGVEGLLRNNVATPFGTTAVFGGTCEITASTVYFGREVISPVQTVSLGTSP